MLNRSLPGIFISRATASLTCCRDFGFRNHSYRGFASKGKKTSANTNLFEANQSLLEKKAIKHKAHNANQRMVEGGVSPFSGSNLKRLSNNQRFGGKLKTCTTASTCEKYDLARVVDKLIKDGFRSPRVYLPGEMVYLRYPQKSKEDDEGASDVLIMANGSVVVWGMNENEVLETIVPMLSFAQIGSYQTVETEDMDYVEEATSCVSGESKGIEETSTEAEVERLIKSEVKSHETESTMIGDVIFIRGATKAGRLLDKAAFSSGLARNTKLATIEYLSDTFIQGIKELSNKLATGRRLGIKSKEALRITGKLLQIRGNLNLYSELIETPDLYWSEPALEGLYTLISRKLDVAPRIAILNKKLDYASELVSILQSHTSEEQSIRLEWMIIALITVEVCFEIIHFAEHYWVPDNEHSSPVQ